MNDGKLNQNYLDTIASSWNRKGVKTVPQAMDAVTKNFKKDTKTVVKAAPKKVIPVPVWMDKDNKREEISDQELEELEREMEIFN